MPDPDFRARLPLELSMVPRQGQRATVEGAQQPSEDESGQCPEQLVDDEACDYGEMLPDPKPYQKANLYPDPNSGYWFAFFEMPGAAARTIPRDREHRGERRASTSRCWSRGGYQVQTRGRTDGSQ